MLIINPKLRTLEYTQKDKDDVETVNQFDVGEGYADALLESLKTLGVQHAVSNGQQRRHVLDIDPDHTPLA